MNLTMIGLRVFSELRLPILCDLFKSLTDKYSYSVYGIGFDKRESFSLSDGKGFIKNVIVFGEDVRSSVPFDNKTKHIFVLGKGSADGLDGTTLTAEKCYSVNFTERQKKFCLSLHYNRMTSYIFFNGIEICRFKPKYSEINTAQLFLANVLKHFSVDNMKKTKLYSL